MIQVTPALGVFLTFNNYSHDIATALLAASGAALWVMERRYRGRDGRALREYFLSIYRGMTRVALVALFWLFISGVPRIVFFRSFEWSAAVADGQAAALIARHVLAFTAVGAGLLLWTRLSRRARLMQKDMDRA